MYYYIVNPAAGEGKINKIQTKLQESLRREGISGEFVKTTGKGDASRIVKIAVREGAKTIVAIGGDSTISEVINSLGNEEKIVLGIIPIGRTNFLASSLGINSWTQAIKVLAKRRVKSISLGKVNDYYFITSLELGFEENLLTNRGESSFLKSIIFKKRIMDKIIGYKGFKAKIDFEKDFSLETDVFNISVSGSRIKEGTKKIDSLSVFLTPLQSKLVLLKNVNSLAKGEYQKLPFISHFQTKRIIIDTFNKPQNVYADSSLVGTTPIEITTSNRSINIIVPPSINQEVDLKNK